MDDIQNLISSLEIAKSKYESESERYNYDSHLSKIFEGTANGLDLAINLIKIESGIRVTEDERYVEDDIYHDESKLA